MPKSYENIIIYYMLALLRAVSVTVIDAESKTSEQSSNSGLSCCVHFSAKCPRKGMNSLIFIPAV